MALIRKSCSECGRRFVARRSDAVTCGPACRQRARRARLDPPQTNPPVTDTEPVPLARASGPAAALAALAARFESAGAAVLATTRKVEVPTRVDEFGDPCEYVEVDPEAEAASHWDGNQWHAL